MTEPKQRGVRAALKHVAAPLLVAFALFAAYVAMLAVPGAWLLVSILIVLVSPTVATIVLALAALLLAAWFWRRHWVSGAAMVAGLLALVLAAAVPNEADSVAQWAAGLAEVVVYRGALQQQAERMRDQGISPPIAVMPLDGFGSMTSGLAYDPSGEIMLPPKERSKAWFAAAGQTDLVADGLEVRPIAGGYYAWFHY